MTCIAAIAEGGKVYMGADSYAGDTIFGHGNRKMMRKRDTYGERWLFGNSGPARVGQILDFEFLIPDSPHPPETADALELVRYLSINVATRLRAILKDDDALMKDADDGLQKMPGTVLIGIDGKIFEIDSAFYVFTPPHPFLAIGRGSPEALGALYATKNQDPFARIALALEASAFYNNSVARPFHYDII